MKKFALSLAIALMMPMVASATTYSFKDIDDSTPYKFAITWMLDQGVIKGYSDGTFKPDKCVNRAEMAKMLTLMTFDFTKDGSYPDFYSDVSHDDWYAHYVYGETAKHSINGYPDGTFKGSDCVNRAEAIKMAMSGFYLEGDFWDNEYNWIDIDDDAWYAGHVLFALASDLVGTEHVEFLLHNKEPRDAKFYPSADMSRGEVAEMLYRMRSGMYDDNDFSNAYEGDIPPMHNVKVSFDGCGDKSDYDDYSWFDDFETLYHREYSEDYQFDPDTKGMGYGESFEGCLSEDGRWFVAVSDKYIGFNSESRTFRFDTELYNLNEATYLGFEGNDLYSSDDPRLIFLSEFGKRDGYNIPMEGYWSHEGYGERQYATYNFVTGTVMYDWSCDGQWGDEDDECLAN